MWLEYMNVNRVHECEWSTWMLIEYMNVQHVECMKKRLSKDGNVSDSTNYLLWMHL